MGKQGYDSYNSDDETEKLLRSVPPPVMSRSGSINDGVLGGIQERPKVYKSRWRSIRVMYLTMFLSSVSFSICMSSLYPYLQILDPSANTDFLGWVVAAYSLGQLMASPLFGAWSNYRSRSREPLIVSLIINVLANILYIYLQSIPHDQAGLMVLTRAGIGFGAGNVAVVRSYVSGATTLKERTSAMANMSAFQAVGFIIGPVIQTALVPIGFPGLVHAVGFHLDMYTAPALLSAILGLVNIALLIVIFREHRVSVMDFKNVQGNSDQEEDDESEKYKPDLKAVISSIILFFSVLFVFAVFETIATPLSMHMFSWTKAQATLYIGIMLGVAGIVSILVFAVIKVCSKRFNERYLLLGGFIICFLGFIIYLPWGHDYPDVQYAALEKSMTNATYQHQVQVTMVTTSAKPSNTTLEAVGCPYMYEWCETTPKLFLWQFMLGTLFVSIGYPTCNVMSYTIYSKILGPKPQGVWMGWLTAAGSAARTLGPVFVSQVYDARGPRWTFASICALILLTTVFFVIVFKRLVPLRINNTAIIKEGPQQNGSIS